MTDMEISLGKLLNSNQVLALSKTDDGFMIAFANVEWEGEDMYFAPTVALTTKATLAEAISFFDTYQTMSKVQGYHA